MIRNFRDKDTERIYYGRAPKNLPNQPKFVERAQSKLKVLNRTRDIRGLGRVPGNRLEPLKGDRKGQWSIAVNKQWRICFLFDEISGDSLDVEITDYH